MNLNRFDRFRSAVGGRLDGTSPLMPALGQQATPSPAGIEHLGLPEGQRTYTMFVQTTKGGMWAPKNGEEGVYTLTLTGLPAQTVYFSDRPERIVGTQSTSDFLAALGFGEENPPNAALVTNTDKGEDILVIELFNPVYTEGESESGATLTYDARILENYHETNLGGVAALQSALDAMPASFDSASLFIDDCANGNVWCEKNGDRYGDFDYGCCYKFPGCYQCHDISNICASLAGCENGQCTLQYGQECIF